MAGRGVDLEVEDVLVQVDARPRWVQVVSGPTRAPGAALLVFFHGSNQKARTVRRFSGGTFDALARDSRAVVAYPDAYHGLWNDARAHTPARARRDGVDDVELFREIVVRAVDGQGVDPSQVYAGGYSNGGQLAIRLAHEVPQLLAGVALFGATQPVPEELIADDRHQPVPVLLVSGTKDPIAPYNGGVTSLFGFRPRGTVMSALDSAAYFAGRNGITKAPFAETVPHRRDSGRTSVTGTHYRQDGHAPVSLYSVEGGGHVIPNWRRRAFPLLGRTTRDVDAGELFWQFALESAGWRSGR